MRDDLLRLLREAWDHGGADAIAYAEERSTRSLAHMNNRDSDELWLAWVFEHQDEIERLTR